ncbi:MAG TPA: hypothetical protein VFV95_16960 [Vicinamibacterales bacterium]|nr:hypothetical protein [Vicinamibacterales bacterium]
MNLGFCGAALIAVAVLSTSVSAQWPRFQAPGVPRDEKGQVRMDAATPRLANGKPDFSGNWVRFRGEGGGAGRGRGAAPAPPPDPGSPPIATFFELGANLPGGLPFTPWAAALRKEREAANSKENPDANCLPMGITQFHMHGQPRKVLHTPELLTLVYEANYGLRYIYTDGRTLPPQGEPQPWWYGYSVGRWEGDTLIVDTNNLRDDGWLDVRGSPLTDQARITERIRRPAYGKLEIDITIEDPKAYTKPFTVRVNQQISPDDEPIEFICNENQQFRRRVKID